MKSISKFLLVAMVAMIVASCSVTVPVTVSKAEIGDLRGVSKSTVFMGIYFNKKYGIKEAAKKGGINSAIATVDEKTINYIIFQKKELIVTAK